MKQKLIRLGVLCLLASLSACGQKGALISPEQAKKNATEQTESKQN